MSPNAHSNLLTPFERARAAYKQMKRRQQRAAELRRMRERVRTVSLAMVIVGTTTGFFGIAIYCGWMPESLRSAAVDLYADRHRAEKMRIGQIRSFVRGDTCREVEFDNGRGIFISASFVMCDKHEEVPDVKGERMNAIRDALRAR